MRGVLPLSLAGWSAAVLALAAAPACSSNPGGNGPGDAGAVVDALAPAFTFTPQGCNYTVGPPGTRGFTDFAPDDTTALGAMPTPTLVRLGLGGAATMGQAGYADPTTTAVLTWETGAANHAAKVQMGTSPTALSTVYTGYVWTTPPPTIGVGVGEPPNFMHAVHICGLTPGTTYYYQVGGGPAGSEVWSATQSFTTVPNTGSVTVGLFGDARDVVMTWQMVHQRMKEAGVNFQLIDGDIVDIGTESSEYTSHFQAIWQDPNNPMGFLTLGEQMMVPIAGNHENEAARFYGAFFIPGTGPYAETFASFNAGNTHFALLDDQLISLGEMSDQATAQLAWLDADLAAADANRANFPFVVVLNHRGVYSTSMHGTDSDVITTRAAIAPLMDKHHVDMVFNGHDHEYERTMPLNAGSPPSAAPVIATSGGTVYVIAAGAGADPYAIGSTPVAYRATNFQFGNGTPYTGVYAMATMAGNMFTLNVYALATTGTKLADDKQIDTVVLMH